MKKKVKDFKVKRVECYRCHKPIDLNGVYLELATRNKGKIVEDVFFHLPTCWGDFNNEKVQNRIIEYQKFGMNLLQKAGLT